MEKNPSYNLNLFEGYSKRENAHSHAFISFVKFLKENHFDSFKKLMLELKIMKSFKNININNIKFSCQSHEIIDGYYDLVIKIDKNIFPVEVKLDAKNINRHHYKFLKKGYKLIYLTNSIKEDLVNKNPLIKKNVNRTIFITWNSVYKAIIKLGIKSKVSKYIIDEFMQFTRDVNYFRSGCIQTLNYNYGDEEYLDDLFKGNEGWHLPKHSTSLDIPNFTVFIYDRKVGKNGAIVGYFVSDGVKYDPTRKNKYDGKWEYEFIINKKDKIDLRNNLLLREDFKKLLSDPDISTKEDIKTYKSDWSKSGAKRWQYKFLNYEQVKTLVEHINKFH